YGELDKRTLDKCEQRDMSDPHKQTPKAPNSADRIDADEKNSPPSRP
ncbi:MAG: hypothetical protein RLZ35_815, partial [Pseudomonadota bacterium]